MLREHVRSLWWQVGEGLTTLRYVSLMFVCLALGPLGVRYLWGIDVRIGDSPAYFSALLSIVALAVFAWVLSYVHQRYGLVLFLRAMSDTPKASLYVTEAEWRRSAWYQQLWLALAAQQLGLRIGKTCDVHSRDESEVRS